MKNMKQYIPFTTGGDQYYLLEVDEENEYYFKANLDHRRSIYQIKPSEINIELDLTDEDKKMVSELITMKYQAKDLPSDKTACFIFTCTYTVKQLCRFVGIHDLLYGKKDGKMVLHVSKNALEENQEHKEIDCIAHCTKESVIMRDE